MKNNYLSFMAIATFFVLVSHNNVSAMLWSTQKSAPPLTTAKSSLFLSSDAEECLLVDDPVDRPSGTNASAGKEFELAGIFHTSEDEQDDPDERIEKLLGAEETELQQGTGSTQMQKVFESLKQVDPATIKTAGVVGGLGLLSVFLLTRLTGKEKQAVTEVGKSMQATSVTPVLDTERLTEELAYERRINLELELKLSMLSGELAQAKRKVITLETERALTASPKIVVEEMSSPDELNRLQKIIDDKSKRITVLEKNIEDLEGLLAACFSNK